MKRYEKALKYCTLALKENENQGLILANRADCFLSMDEFEKAKNDFKKAHDMDNQNQRVRLYYNTIIL